MLAIGVSVKQLAEARVFNFAKNIFVELYSRSNSSQISHEGSVDN